MAPAKPIPGSILTLLCLMAKLKEEALEFVESIRGTALFLWDLFVYLMCSTPQQLENSVKQPQHSQKCVCVCVCTNTF